jgi:hypothetical protein
MRKVLAWIMIAVWPISGIASDAANAGMLSAQGKVTLNGNPVSGSIAIFPGSVVETNSESLANITISGSTAILQPGSLARFDGSEIYLDHGGVTVGSSSGLRVHVKCVTATPASNAWTQFDVLDVSGTVQVVDRKSPVNISSGAPFDLLKASTATTAGQTKPKTGLTEGQQYNGYESEGCPNSGKKGAPPAAVSSIFDAPYAPYIGAGVIAGVTTWVLLQHPDPISGQDP